MKKVLLLLSILSSFTAAQNFNWEWQNSYPQGNNIRDAVILSGNRYVCAGDKSTMMVSTDAGNTWNINCPDSISGKRDIYQLAFPTATVGFACGTSGLIMKTTDAGNTWYTLGTPVTTNLYYINFLDADTGYVCGASSALYKTTNGGMSWKNLTLTDATTIYKVYFVNNQVGYLGTSNSTPGYLLKTTDYGTTWTKVLGYTGTTAVRGIYFTDANTGFVTDQTYSISKTTDGGNTWNLQDFGTGTFNEVKFFDANNGAASGIDGQVYITSDAGNTWNITSIGLSPNAALYGLALEGNSANPTINTLFVVGECGVMAKSSNMGANWTQLVRSATRDELRRIKFVTPSVGYAIGGGTAGGTILKTTDAGQNWTKLSFNPGYELYSQAWIDANTGYVARRGPDGVFKTTDGGNTFVQQNPGIGISTDNLYLMGFANADTGWIGNGAGNMAKTTNGGTTWTSIVSPFPATYNGYNIFVFDSKNLVVVGYSGKVYKSTDGGNSWTPINATSMTSTLYTVYFTSPNTGYVAGVSGKCYKTTDGGNTWTALTTGVSAAFYNVMFLDQNIGWLTGTSGTVLFTTDAGSTWTASSKYPSSGTAYGCSIIDQSIYIAGVKGNILKGYSNPTLPVELLAFSASASGNNISLNWQTATEINNRGFSIERKADNSNFEVISFVNGKGSSTVQTKYTYTDQVNKPGTYVYRLKQVDYNGTTNYSNEVQVEVSGTLTYNLEQNYPNPFNPSTTIKYSIPQDGFIKLNLYNVLGQKVKELFNGFRNAGSYTYTLDASKLASGMYLYKLETSSYSQTRKMILMK